MNEFCTHCKICAEICPSSAISFEPNNKDMTTKGYRHWEINQTSWWKWLLTALWYILLNFFAFLDFTLICEGESEAGLKLLFVQAIFMIVLSVGLVRVLGAGRQRQP